MHKNKIETCNRTFFPSLGHPCTVVKCRFENANEVFQIRMFNCLESLAKMLQFNGYFQREEENPVWKVLIFDSHTQDILSSLVKVSQLRNEGVTIFRPINSIDDSCTIPDVPVVFFVQATEQNLQRICSFLRQDIFSFGFVNCCGFMSKTHLEFLAEQACTVNPRCHDKICQVYDMFCDFVCLHENLFLLPNTAISIREELQDSEVECIAQGLLCVFATTGQIPLIRCRAGATRTEFICRRLVELVRDQLMIGKGNIFETKSSGILVAKRPLLVLIDRREDLVTPLKHSWSYNAMLHDLYGIVQNRVCMKEKGEKYDLDLDEDFIWNRFGQMPTFEVAAGIDQELTEYLQEKERISQITGMQEITVNEPIENVSTLGTEQRMIERKGLLSKDSLKASQLKEGGLGSTTSLREVIDKIPELTKNKPLLDLHTNFATNLIRTVGENKLDQYLLNEAQAHSLTDEKIISGLIGPEAPGTELDRLRFLLILLFVNERIAQRLEHWKSVLSLPNYNPLIDAILELKAGQFEMSTPTSPIIQSVSKYSFGTLQRSRMGEMLGSFVSGMKNLLPDSADLPVTKITESLLTVSTSNSFSNDFLYLDPRQLLPTDRLYMPDRECFDEVFVFVVGGATYSEWNGLSQLAKRHPKLQITVGSTEMLNGQSFIQKFMK